MFQLAEEPVAGLVNVDEIKMAPAVDKAQQTVYLPHSFPCKYFKGTIA